jgi:hypothetical protein
MIQNDSSNISGTVSFYFKSLYVSPFKSSLLEQLGRLKELNSKSFSDVSLTIEFPYNYPKGSLPLFTVRFPHNLEDESTVFPSGFDAFNMATFDKLLMQLVSSCYIIPYHITLLYI